MRELHGAAVVILSAALLLGQQAVCFGPFSGDFREGRVRRRQTRHLSVLPSVLSQKAHRSWMTAYPDTISVPGRGKVPIIVLNGHLRR